MEKDKNKKMLDEYLTSALDLEDRMSTEIYSELRSRDSWPADLNEEIYINIKNLLDIVLKETEIHKKAFSDLQKKLNDN